MIRPNTNFIELSYKTSVPVRGRLISSNRFLKVNLLEKDYYLSSISGFHNSTLEEVNFKVLDFFTQYTLSFDEIDFTKRFFNLTAEDSYLKSFSGEILFHIESLLLGILRTTHPQLFSKKEVLINQLYRSETPLENYKESKCLKIKINPRDALKTAVLLNELYEMNPNILTRLDGNRQFELEDMLYFEETLKEKIHASAFLKIDYIEEPFKIFYDSEAFLKRSDLSIAIDESFLFLMNVKLNFPSVIKPSFIGLSPVMFWLRSHKDQRAIISSSFEHPSILEGLFFLAQERPSEFHGLENFIEITH